MPSEVGSNQHDAGFAIVASGPNSASPHHDAGERVIEAGDAIVLDIGGTRASYCSDTSRTVFVGDGLSDRCGARSEPVVVEFTVTF